MTLVTPDRPVYVLRTCGADMTSYKGFKWPRRGKVVAPDWNATDACGNGLHGFLWGEGDGGLADWSPDAVWLVAKVAAYVDLGGKVKFPEATVVFAGSRHDATQKIIALGAMGAVIGATVTAGYRGTATAGDRGTAMAGYGGTAMAGYGGTAMAGDGGTATAGDRGTAMAGDGGTATVGDYGTATAGDYGTAMAGYGGTAMAGDGGVLQIAWWDGRSRVAVAYVGENDIKPDTAYRLDGGGNFVEVGK